jgi:hypothetical protein
MVAMADFLKKQWSRIDWDWVGTQVDEFGLVALVFGIPIVSAVTLVVLLGWWFS